jgi:hypothetical protein
MKNKIFDFFKKKQWEDDFCVVEISSSYDKQIQKAYFYASKKTDKMPLIVSLHSWSNDYKENDPLAELFKNEDWNYIHPDFRGANTSPLACMSEEVIHDIDDAIAYAIITGNVDENKIIVVGGSGGGMATLGIYLRSSYNLCYCMAWVPITNLELWYYQSKYADTKYWKDIIKCTTSSGTLNITAMQRRSPLFFNPSFPAPYRNNVQKTRRLEIYAGINDGYTGAVSVYHTLLFHNKMASYLGLDDAVVSDKDIIMLLSRSVKNDSDEYIGERKLLYKKSHPSLGLFIFDGTHEILSAYAFERIIISSEN